MFEHWDSFFLLIGGAAGALIGLMFVVVTLTSRLNPEQTARAASVYMTPIIYHFAAVLVLSAVCTVGHAPADILGAVLGFASLVGFAASLRVAVHLRIGRLVQASHWTDFWWYGAAPSATYLALTLASAAICFWPEHAAADVAAGLVALLLVGIRNAWDLVTWMAPRQDRPEKMTPPPGGD